MLDSILVPDLVNSLLLYIILTSLHLFYILHFILNPLQLKDYLGVLEPLYDFVLND